MDERMMQMRVGVVMAAALLVTAIFLVMFGNLPQFMTTTYPMHVWFKTAPGIMEGTPVSKSGLLLGRVSDIQFARDYPRKAKVEGITEEEFQTGVIVTIAIEDGKRIYTNEECVINKDLLGDAEIIIKPTKRPVTGDYYKGDVVLYGQVPPDPFEMAGDFQKDLKSTLEVVGKTSDSLVVTSTALTGTLNRINNILDQNQGGLNEAITNANNALTRVADVADNVNMWLGDEQMRDSFKQTLDSIPQALADARRAIGEIRYAACVARQRFEELGGLTEPLGQNGAERVRQFDIALYRLNNLATQLDMIARKVNSGDGTLSHLINDPTLYHNLSTVTRDIKNVSTQLQPAIRNLNVFTDKIARDPGEIGVRGALRKNNPVKYQ